MTYDVVMVGAGIVGAACAYECTRQRMRVAVFDADLIGGGATAAAMGHVVVMDDSEAQFALTRYSQQLWRELRNELPPDTEHDNCGTVWVASDDEELIEAGRKLSYFTQRGVAAELLDAKTLKELEPNLKDGLAGGLLVPADSVLYPPCAARFFSEQAVAGGATFYSGCAVAEIRKGSILLRDGREFSAAIIVNAAGAWAGDLTPGLGIRKRKGHLAITDRYPGFVRHQLVELGYLKRAHAMESESVAFNVQPRKTGQLLIGSSRQFGVEDKGIDRNLLAAMMQRSQQYLPGLARMSVLRSWTGFRPATADNLPLIGPWPENPALYIVAGHEGLGITTCLASARLLVDRLTNRSSAISFEPYLPSRIFQERAHA